jgi:hypothetical protein
VRSHAAHAPTLLAGEQLGELFGAAFDGVGRLEERGRPGVVAQGSPGGLGCLRVGNGLFEVLEAVDGCFTHRFSCGRIKDGPAGPGRGGDGREKGIVGFQELLHFE